MPTWVWVEDMSTGHQYDVDQARLPLLGQKVRVVEDVPVRTGRDVRPRPVKYRVDKDGSPNPGPVKAAPARPDTTKGRADR